MKRSVVAVTTVALMCAVPASAQKLDLSTVTCEEFLELGKENIALMMIWLHGYFTEEDEPPVIDLGRMKTDVEKFGEYCVQHPDTGVVAAAQRFFRLGRKSYDFPSTKRFATQ